MPKVCVDGEEYMLIPKLGRNNKVPKVIIDGVEYIPAKEALANRMDIAKGLLMNYWGTCSNEKAEELIRDPCIKVLVHDWDAGGVTLSEVLDDIAKIPKPVKLKEKE